MFLELNPSLKKEQELFGKTRMVPDLSIVYEDKALLKKTVIVPFGSINAMNYEEYMIAMIEGDLKPEEEKAFAEFMVLNPGLQKEFSLFEKTKAEPDKSVVFEGKEQLKKMVEQVPVYTLSAAAKQSNVFRWRNILYPISIAATVIIAMMVYFKLNPVDLSKGRFAANNSSININRTVSSSTAQNNNFITAAHSSDNKKANRTKNVQLAGPVRMHELGLSPIAAPENYPDKMVLDDTYRELYAIIREKRYEQESAEKKEDHYYSLDQFASYNVKKSLKPADERGKVRPDDKLTMWDVADAGIRKFNNLTGADAKLNHSDDNSFSLALGDNFSYSRGGRK